MGSTMEVKRPDTGLVRVMLMFLMVLALMFAARDVHAAKKDKSMCDGLKGAAKGFCTAAAALGCGAPTKHQKQCDVLGDKFEALTGDTPPWEDPPPPPPPPPPTGLSVTLGLDVDAFDLDTRTMCENALGAACNLGNPDDIVPPNDFWVSVDDQAPDVAVFVPVLVCDFPVFTVGIAVLPNTPFASVDSSTLAQLLAEGKFAEDLTEVGLAAGDTLVIRTCDLGYFKVGNATFVGNSVTLSYDELHF